MSERPKGGLRNISLCPVPQEVRPTVGVGSNGSGKGQNRDFRGTSTQYLCDSSVSSDRPRKDSLVGREP